MVSFKLVIGRQHPIYCAYSVMKETQNSSLYTTPSSTTSLNSDQLSYISLSLKVKYRESGFLIDVSLSVGIEFI